MKLKMAYQHKLLLFFFFIIAIFTVGILLFEKHQVKVERTRSIERVLDTDISIIRNYLQANHVNLNEHAQDVEALLQYMSPDLRITIINLNGFVLYDNRVDAHDMENHLSRPEVIESLNNGSSSHIRLSETNDIRYLYYARSFAPDYIIRLALPYNVEVQQYLNSCNSFVYFILAFFVLCLVMVLYFARKFSTSIKKLKLFAEQLKKDENATTEFSFPNDEVGEVSEAIAENYQLLQENRLQLAHEREKLLQHFEYAEEGIAIFSKERKKQYANTHFLQYINLILDKSSVSAEAILADESFQDAVAFLDDDKSAEIMYSKRVHKNGKRFSIRVIKFEDGNFEISIADITKAEKTRLLKQEMTNNIAHELRTPVTTIRGYLETLQNLKPDDEDRRKVFIERAYNQSLRLSELIQDIAMLTKIEEAAERFVREPVEMEDLLLELGGDLYKMLKKNNVTYRVEVDENIVVHGSRTLLYSIFRNLCDNSLAYAGENIDIVIRCYAEDSNAYFFEYYDTGTGVDDKYLGRIFERFYRINEGRTRNTGGSGLGLSIVKNAVLLHQGNIVAKNRKEGGLSFLITFPKGIHKTFDADTLDEA